MSTTIALSEMARRAKVHGKAAFKLKDGEAVTATGGALSAIDEEKRTAIFTMSDGTLDLAGDRLVAAGAQLEQFLRNPQFLFGHDSQSLPIGKWLRVWVEDEALKGEALFAEESANPLAEQCWQLLKAGMLSAVSVGFRIIDGEWNGPGMVVSEWLLLECSLVPIPCNPNALLDGKSLGAALRGLAAHMEKTVATPAPKAAPAAPRTPPAIRVMKEADPAAPATVGDIESIATALLAAFDERIAKVTAAIEALAGEADDKGEDAEDEPPAEPPAKGAPRVVRKGATHRLSASQMGSVKSALKSLNEMAVRHHQASGAPDGDADESTETPPAEEPPKAAPPATTPAPPLDAREAWLREQEAAGFDRKALEEHLVREAEMKRTGRLA